MVQFRHSQDTRVFWIDAICINQREEDEKNKQVIRMGDIFHSASRVVVWLGPEAMNSRDAMQTLSYLGKQFILVKPNWICPTPERNENSWWHTKHLPYNAKHWAAISYLITRPWFSRMWVLQENQLANRNAVI